MRDLNVFCRQSEGHKISDQQFSMLMNTGLLTRDVGKQSCYLFAVAGAGKLVTSITKGRKVGILLEENQHLLHFIPLARHTQLLLPA